MTTFAIANPGLVRTSDGTETQIFTIDIKGSRRILHTSEFFQAGREREELLCSQGAVSWDVLVPEGALVFGGTSAALTGFSQQFWVGWLLGRRLHMQALMQLTPIDSELAEHEVAILPAVTDFSGVANLYTWKPVGEGTALWRHSFKGAIHSVGSTNEEALYAVPGRPMVSVAGTIPGERAQHAVLGWVEASAAGSILGIAVVMPDRIRVARSKPIEGMMPFPHQRPGIWAAPRFVAAGRIQLVAMLQSQATRPSYSVASLDLYSDSDAGSLSLSPSALPAGVLHAAAFDLEPNQIQPFLSRTYLTEQGILMRGDPPIEIRRDVPLDSPLPVAVTNYYYWGTRAADQTMRFDPL